MKRIAPLLAAVILFASPGRGRADDGDDEEGEIEQSDEARSYGSVAVQNRLYSPTNEITAFVGVLPLDAFTKGLTFGGAYTLHFSDLMGWEVVNGLYSLHLDTSLKDDLATLDTAPTPFEVLDYMLTSNLLFKPIYWKGSWLNDSIVHGELFGVLGGGFASFTRSTRIATNVGLGVRLFLSETFSVRFDIRYLAFLNTSIFEGLNVRQEIWSALGLSIF